MWHRTHECVGGGSQHLQLAGSPPRKTIELPSNTMLAEHKPDLPDDVLVQARRLLDELWDGDEPEPSPHEIVALLSLTAVMGKTNENHDAAVQTLMLLLSLPSAMRRRIEVNVQDGRCRYADGLDEALE